jgi:hypothetical protein
MGFLTGLFIGVTLGWCAAALVIGGKGAREVPELGVQERGADLLFKSEAGGSIIGLEEDRQWGGRKTAV